jgi:hypothetical protein
MQWLWLSRTDSSHYWLALSLRDDPMTVAFFNNSITLHLGDGQLFSFWTDPWLDDVGLATAYPELVAAVPLRLRKRRSVASALHGNAWARDVQGALTIPVLVQFLQLHQRLATVVLQAGVQDSFSWRWCSSGCFSTPSAYRALFTGQSAVLGAKELWKSRAPNKCRFFVWLLLHGRCWTSDRLFSHGLQDYRDCALCNQSAEVLDHLILSCPLAAKCVQGPSSLWLATANA